MLRQWEAAGQKPLTEKCKESQKDFLKNGKYLPAQGKALPKANFIIPVRWGIKEVICLLFQTDRCMDGACFPWHTLC